VSRLAVSASSVGDLQTIFYLALVGGILLTLTLFLLGVGFAGLPAFFRRPGHRLLASLITGALAFTSVFIAATSGILVYAVGHRG
jgi:hypothetical protein